ncbi:hypothetical protein ACP70R_003178 [Stipagrostis hirtigluma subsp. patula]
MEKFAGDLYTTSMEMFDIKFEDEMGKRSHVWQNSWPYSTRSIGVMVMTHGDDKGLVLPPRVAQFEVVVIPVPYKDTDIAAIKDACETIVGTLKGSRIRVKSDTRENYSLGWKYSCWEMKGVPLRIEIGPKDLANKQVRIVRRDNGVKADIPMVNMVKEVQALRASIQENLLNTAKEKRDACEEIVKTWDEFVAALNDKKLILAPWCDEEDAEKDVKERTKGELGGAKTLCTPFDQPKLPEGTLCFALGKAAKGIFNIVPPNQIQMSFPLRPPWIARGLDLFSMSIFRPGENRLIHVLVLDGAIRCGDCCLDHVLRVGLQDAKELQGISFVQARQVVF